VVKKQKKISIKKGTCAVLFTPAPDASTNTTTTVLQAFVWANLGEQIPEE